MSFSWHNFIRFTLVVYLAALGRIGMSAPSSATKAEVTTHGPVRVALNKKKAKKQKQAAKRSKKQAKAKETKAPRQDSRWQAPARSTDSGDKAAWIPKQGTKSPSKEGSGKPKRAKKATAAHKSKSHKHQAKAKSKMAETPKVTPKAPVVSITPPETAPPTATLAREEPAKKPQETTPTPDSTPDSAPKTKPKPKKGLSAKALKGVKRPPMADIESGSEPLGDGNGNAGASFLMLLTFLVASAGTFVYFKRREELSKVVRAPQAKPTTPIAPKARPAASKPLSIPVSATSDPGSLAPNQEEPPPELATTALIPRTEPCTFERFAEMQVALSCWIEKGADAMSSMQTYFNITEQEWLTVSAYWNQRYLADDELIRQFNNLAPDFRAKYGGTAA